MKPSVLFLSDTSLTGGVLTYIKEVAPLIKEWYDVHVSINVNENTKYFVEAISSHKVPIFDTKSLLAGKEATRYDVVLATAFSPFGYKKFFRKFSQVVILLHDQVDIFYPEPFQTIYRLGYRILQVPNLKQCRAIITVSYWAANFLKAYYKIERTPYVVPNGVDPNRFKPATNPEKAQAKQRLGIEDVKTPVVLVPGRLSPEKNPFAALYTAKLRRDLTFLFVGDGELREPLRFLQRVWKLDNVLFLGKRKDMEVVYQAVDVVVQPTLGENQSLTTLEAMASGLPVVTTPIAAQKELIEHAQTGFLVNPKPKLISKMIDEALENKESIGQNARKHVLEKHTLQNTARALKQAIEDIIGNHEGD